MDADVGIIGFGPAGMSAAIYAKRYGFRVLAFEHGVSGGNAALSPLIENYLGFPAISGSELAGKMEEHAMKYVDKLINARVEHVKKIDGGFELTTHEGKNTVRSIILATGTKHRKLNVKGETEFTGKGVSYCATCDGFFFKNKRVAVIGGGNTAAVEALYLRDLGAEVYLIHRRNALRAEEVYYRRLLEKGVKILWNSVVAEIYGTKKVEGLKIKSTTDGSISDVKIDGVFVAIGDDPQNEIANEIGVALTENGYVIVDASCRTNVRFVYAAGDITGVFNQIIVAASQGAIAARSAYEDMTR
jgi:thioredoxin reductase (NADPH)